MGNRANVQIIQPEGMNGHGGGSVFLYTHWGGIECTTRAVSRALRELPGRWTDESYLARGIFVRMMADQKAEWLGETSFGIATYPPDNEHPILVVDCEEQEVRVDDHPIGAGTRFADAAKEGWTV